MRRRGVRGRAGRGIRREVEKKGGGKERGRLWGEGS